MFCPFFERWKSKMTFAPSLRMVILGFVWKFWANWKWSFEEASLTQSYTLLCVFSWAMDLQCDAWVMWPRGVWPLSSDSWISYCHFFSWFSMVLEQNIRKIAALTWSFSIGLCWSMTTVAMPRGVFIEYAGVVSKMKPSDIHTKDVDISFQSILNALWCTSQFTNLK